MTLWKTRDGVSLDALAEEASPADLLAAVRRGVESGTIKGDEVNLCHVHGSVMTGAVFHEGQRICQYAWYSGHAVEACFGYRGVVVPVLDGDTESTDPCSECGRYADWDECPVHGPVSDGGKEA